MFRNVQITDRVKFPYEIKKVHPKTNEKLLRFFQAETNTFLQVGPQNYFFPNEYKKYAEIYYNFEVRPDDIWIASFPRSGTTWTQEMIWLLANNHDYETASKIPLTERFPCLEASMYFNPKTTAKLLEINRYNKENQDIIEEVSNSLEQIAKNQSTKRFIKTHLPFSLLPPNLLSSGCKIIYIARHPKDVAISYYHFNKHIINPGYCGDFEKFLDFFMKNLVYYSPHKNHIEEAWQLRHLDNVLFITYDQMSKNIKQVIKQTAQFLGKEVEENELVKLKEHLKFENFKINKSVNYDFFTELGITTETSVFIRKGTSSREELRSTDLLEKIDRWVEDNMKNINMRSVMEI